MAQPSTTGRYTSDITLQLCFSTVLKIPTVLFVITGGCEVLRRFLLSKRFLSKILLEKRFLMKTFFEEISFEEISFKGISYK